MRVNNLKLISLLCISAGLTACSGSGNVSSNRDNPLGMNKPTQNKSVTISRLPTIPTNGSIGQHYLRVTNNTDETLKLKDFKISKSDSSKILDRMYDSVNRALGGSGYDPRISMATCETLLKDSSCTIAFTPDSSDGSTGVQLNFNANNGEQFSAAQLINYSSQSTQQGGFIVNNDSIQHIDSTVNYSISIPFITNDDYATIDVVSRVITLDKSVDCTKDVKKGAHCTATLTLPVASAAGYANDISLVGKKADGTQKIAYLSSGSRAADSASVVMSNNAQVLTADKNPANNVLKVTLVNNGDIDAIGFADKHTAIQSWESGITASSDKTYLSKSSDCLANISVHGQMCEVEFRLENPNASGFDRYNISYLNGDGGFGEKAEQSTILYYKGLLTDGGVSGSDDYLYTVAGSLNFDKTAVNRSITQSLSIKNVGREILYNIKVAGLPTDKGFTQVSNCPQSLAVGSSCSYNITYSPTELQAATEVATVKVLAYKQLSEELEDVVAPPREFSLLYSAIDEGGAGFVFLTPAPEFSAELGAGAVKKSIVMQNTGSVPYDLQSIRVAPGQTWPAKLVATAPAMFGDSPNPLSGLVLTGGESTAINKRIAASESAVLEYVYGPFTEGELEVPKSTVTQNFEATGGSLYALVSTYEVKASTLNITGPAVIFDRPEGGSGTITNGGNFTLFKTTNFRMLYDFKAERKTVANLLINDSDLPYGFTVDKSGTNTTCHTLSAGDTVGKTLAIGEECRVTYLFVAPSLLNHSLFYTAAANPTTPHAMIKPSFSYDDAGKRVYVANSQKFTFTAKPFAQFTPELTPLEGVSPTSHKYRLRVDANSLHPSLSSNSISVKPIAIDGITLATTGCTISTAVQFCQLDMVIDDRLFNKPLSVNYSTIVDGDYNSINQAITIPPAAVPARQAN